MRIRGMYLWAVLVLALLLVVTGCGKSSEIAAEKALEKAAGENAQVDIKKDGEVEIKTTEGTLNVGGNYEWPDRLPEDVPRLTEGKIISIMESEEEDSKGEVYVGLDNVTVDAYEKYKAELTNSGWTIVASSKEESEFMIMATKGERNLAFIFTKSGDQGFTGGIAYVEKE